MRIKVLYEDPNILAIDKPTGILAHPALESAQSEASPNKTKNEETILDWAQKKYPKAELVHRLDRETSGVMLVAKNGKAHEFLKSQFANREVKKIYHAIVSGSVKNDFGTIDAGRGARGELREAVTEYKVLKRFQVRPQESPSEGRCLRVLAQRSLSARRPARVPPKEIPATFTYLEVKPKTGRTHQIRVHMKYLNHPRGLCPKGISRLALHAASIEFKNLKGKNIKVESPLPEEFSALGGSASGGKK